MIGIKPSLPGIILLLGGLPCYGLAPTLYSSAAYESPVRADADDLLMLPGYGFTSQDTVVYRAIGNTTLPLVHPPSIPGVSTDLFGVAELVTAVDAPYSLTVRLPAAIRRNQSYALWTVTPAGEWSNGIKINDARPLWITPDEVYASKDMGAMPRILKVVGRNLQPASGASTQVRLLGPAKAYVLVANRNTGSGGTMDRYVVKLNLPPQMPAGSYEVQISRDGASWVPMLNDRHTGKQTLRVIPDPEMPNRFPVGKFTFGSCVPGAASCVALPGACAPSSDDQTVCIAAAIAAAQDAGGGVVEFGPGIWAMNSPGLWASGHSFSNKNVSHDGVVVPPGVSLEGAGSSATTLVRGAAWDVHVPSFALQGHNTVAGFTFRDARKYQNNDQGTALLMLGGRPDRVNAHASTVPTQIDHVVIAENVFDKPFVAIGNDGLAIDHLIVSKNVFGAFKTALSWEGNPANTALRYHYSNSVVANNRFFPGSYLDTAIRQGTIAAALSGGYHIDFSDNIADGTSAAYLYSPDTDAKGWRAGFFWAMHDNIEMMLVSQNSATCSGDKDGDGEAIAYDNNHNRAGFPSITAEVLKASTDSGAGTSTISVRGALIDKQNSYGVSIDVSPVSSYYVGDWLQVVQGPGIGQARKILTITPGSEAGGDTTSFTVAPEFDVLPQQNSLVLDGRLQWQTFTIANVIDQRKPLCLKSNRTRRAGGLITLYAATSDSVVEGNAQYDTSGIVIAQQFQLPDVAAGIEFPGGFAQSFNEIRANSLTGAYDEQDRSPQAEYGIAVLFAATPNTAPPPTMSYGLAISHNIINGAAVPKGAIALDRGWFTGPKSREFPGITPWKIAAATLVFKNELTDFDQPHMRGTGIGLSAANPTAPVEWRSVLYGNVCHGAWAPAARLVDRGTETIRHCPSIEPDSCECNGEAADLAISAKDVPASAPVGSPRTYALHIVNHGPSRATGVTLSAEPSASMTITSMSSEGTVCAFADPNVNICRLGKIDVGATAAVTVHAILNSVGPASATFSVAHGEADGNAVNDGVAIATLGTSSQ